MPQLVHHAQSEPPNRQASAAVLISTPQSRRASVAAIAGYMENIDVGAAAAFSADAFYSSSGGSGISRNTDVSTPHTILDVGESNGSVNLLDACEGGPVVERQESASSAETARLLPMPSPAPPRLYAEPDDENDMDRPNSGFEPVQDEEEGDLDGNEGTLRRRRKRTLSKGAKFAPRSPEKEELGSGDDVCLPASAGVEIDYEAITTYLTTRRKGSANGGGVSPVNGKEMDWRKSFQEPDSSPRFTFYSEATGALQANRFDALDFSRFETPVGEILKKAPFWIDVCDPSHSEMVMFSRFFGIHPLTTEDIQTQDTREKCETFINYYFICIRTFGRANDYSLSYIPPINVYMVVFRECILSFHARPIDHPNNVLRRIEQLQAYGLDITPDWINYALIDDITDAFMPLLRFIELEVDSIDDLVLILKESEQSDMLRRIGHARKKVMHLLRLLTNKADVLKTVIKRCGERLAPESETTLYLGDIQDHVITMVQNLSHYEKTLARSHSNYLAQISIEITQASNRTNDVVMKMTAVASILVPLNIITGLWGMNVPVPGRDSEGYAWFFGIIALMAVVSAVIYVWIRRQAVM
ncbi:CorA metal ion transporter [Borealophlyctis nickersoniae]|nr:CorA metal ion transporter [Borealophlyctis nickersoniae]